MVLLSTSPINRGHNSLHGNGKGRAEWERPGESGCSSESVGEEANENFASAWGSDSG
jgi:hypothetical protein